MVPVKVFPQTAQIEPDKAGGDAQHPGKDDAHGDEQGHRRQGAHRDPGFVFHINCPPVFSGTAVV